MNPEQQDNTQDQQVEARICPIFDEEIVVEALIPCGHEFEKDALIEWTRTQAANTGRQSNCPICRTPYKPTDITSNGQPLSAEDQEKCTPPAQYLPPFLGATVTNMTAFRDFAAAAHAMMRNIPANTTTLNLQDTNIDEQRINEQADAAIAIPATVQFLNFTNLNLNTVINDATLNAQDNLAAAETLTIGNPDDIVRLFAAIPAGNVTFMWNARLDGEVEEQTQTAGRTLRPTI